MFFATDLYLKALVICAGVLAGEVVEEVFKQVLEVRVGALNNRATCQVLL